MKTKSLNLTFTEEDFKKLKDKSKELKKKNKSFENWEDIVFAGVMRL